MNTLGVKLLAIAGATAVVGGILSIAGGKPSDTVSQVDKQDFSGQEQVVQRSEDSTEKRLPNRALASSITSAKPIISEKPAVVTLSANSVSTNITQAQKVQINTDSSTNMSIPNKIYIAAKNHRDSQIAAAARMGEVPEAPQVQQQRAMALPTMQVQMQRPAIKMPTMPVMPTPPQLPVPERFLQIPQYFVQQPAVSSK